MLTMVEMNVRIPVDFDKEEAERLKASEKQRFQELQRAGKWRHTGASLVTTRTSASSTSKATPSFTIS